MKTLIIKPSLNNLKLVEELIKNNGVVAFPTDTVYGIGASIYSDTAINKIYELKHRDNLKALPIMVGKGFDLTQIVTDISTNAHKLMCTFWPGALTIIFKSKNNFSKLINKNLNTVAVRMPNHETALKILEISPLAVTSANISGQPSAKTAEEVKNYLDKKLPLIIDGVCNINVESTIVDASENEIKILRVGAITPEEIFKVLK